MDIPDILTPDPGYFKKPVKMTILGQIQLKIQGPVFSAAGENFEKFGNP